MEYNHISTFFTKIKQTLFKKEEYCKAISQIINKHIAVEINPQLIKIKRTIINIQSSPLFKNEILINKKNILDDLSQIIKDIKFTDIK